MPEMQEHAARLMFVGGLSAYAYGAFTDGKGGERPGGTSYSVWLAFPDATEAPAKFKLSAGQYAALSGLPVGAPVDVEYTLFPKSYGQYDRNVKAISPVAASAAAG